MSKCLTVGQHEALNDAVREATAFGCWKEMRQAMEGGYCPTLRDDFGGFAFRQAVRTIRAHMDDRGWAYFDGRRVVNG